MAPSSFSSAKKAVEHRVLSVHRNVVRSSSYDPRGILTFVSKALRVRMSLLFYVSSEGPSEELPRDITILKVSELRAWSGPRVGVKIKKNLVTSGEKTTRISLYNFVCRSLVSLRNYSSNLRNKASSKDESSHRYISPYMGHQMNLHVYLHTVQQHILRRGSTISRQILTR